MHGSTWDTIHHAETPEGVSLTLRAAGPIVRSWAWVIDTLIRLGLYVALFTTLPLLGNFGTGLALVCVFVVEWFYPVLFEVLRNGATPGKAVFGLRVVQDDGLPVDWYASMTRNILRTIDFLPFLYAAGLVSMLITRDFRRIGDLAAGTIVIYQRPPQRRGELAAATAEPPPVPLSATEQRAVLGYGRRLPSMSEARGDELAGLLQGPLGASGPAVRQRLVGIANWIVGRTGDVADAAARRRR